MIKFRFKLRPVPVFPILIVISISLFALLMLYSIGAGSFYPWCIKQLGRLLLGVAALMIVASVNCTVWRKYAYHCYACCLLLLGIVAIAGKISMGAQRWLNLYFFNFQPSELMRMFLVVALAKYFSSRGVNEINSVTALIMPLILTAVPIGLVLLQPDLGTAVLLFCICVSVLFACGVQIWKFVTALAALAISAPILWGFLHEYQKKRILMFLSPELDPNGAGYHIIQSKIALGSGGFFGNGLLNGSQCQLNFLPEKQTDFVFAALGEELGFLGCILLMAMYATLLVYNHIVAIKARTRFNQIIVFGINAMLFFYIFINMSMVCGLLPVVGVPLPFFSYGGSSLVVLMACQGLVFAADYEQKHSFGLPG